MTQKEKKKLPRVPRLKQRQRLLHFLKGFFRVLHLSVFIASLYGLYLLWELDIWKIKEVELINYSSFGFEYFHHLDPKKQYQEQHIFLTDPMVVAKNLSNHRIFKDITVYRSLFPAKLQIIFTERLPYRKIFNQNKNISQLIDAEGIILPYYKPEKIYPRPSRYLINQVNDFTISSEQLNSLNFLENFAREYYLDKNYRFDISSAKNIIVFTPKNKILLGDLSDFGDKMRTIPLLENLAEKEADGMEYIDLKYWKSPVLKKKGRDKNE